MNQYTLNLSKQEVEVLVQLLDIAIKSGGLNVAEPAVVLYKKVEGVVKETDNPTVIEE